NGAAHATAPASHEPAIRPRAAPRARSCTEAPGRHSAGRRPRRARLRAASRARGGTGGLGASAGELGGGRSLLAARGGLSVTQWLEPGGGQYGRRLAGEVGDRAERQL